MADEYILLDGHKLDDVQDISKQQGTPALSDYLLVVELDTGKEVSKTKHYSVDTLIKTLGKTATDAEQGAIDAKTAVEEMKTAVETAISSFNTKIESDNSAWDAKVLEDLQSLQTALTSALAAIGKSDTEGARGDAIESIAAALSSALSSIGQTDEGGVRGAAITSINATLQNILSAIEAREDEALSAIGQTDSEGARGEAISSINEKVSAFNEKVTEDNSAWYNHRWQGHYCNRES